MGLVVGEVTSATASETSRSTPRSWRDGIILCRLYCPQASRWTVSLCVCVRIPLSHCLADGDPTESGIRRTLCVLDIYVSQRSESIVILCSYYTDGHTIAHRSRFVCFWKKKENRKKKSQKKEEKEVLATGKHPVLSAVMLFFSSPPLTFTTPIKISLSHSFAFVLIIR